MPSLDSEHRYHPTLEEVAGDFQPYRHLLSKVFGGRDDGYAVRPERILEVVSAVGTALGTLNPRERKVLEQRFGMLGEELKTLKEVGDGLGVGRERVRQIEAKALRKLEHQSRGLAETIPLPIDSIGRTKNAWSRACKRSFAHFFCPST